ncbi:retrotransposon protein, putative, ty1-copia subclass [Tanacetum coccineum]
MTTPSANNSVFRGFLKKKKLFGPNFIDWSRQLRIVLLAMEKLDYLEQPIPPAHVPTQAGQQVSPEVLAAHAAWVKRSKEIARIMLMTMEPEIQLYLENFSAYEMLQELKTLFAHQANQELLQTVQNYSMHGMGKMVNELHAMRKLHEKTQPKYKHAYHPKPKISPPLKKKNPAKDSICHQCGETGHWKRNCPHNLAELLKNMNLFQGTNMVQGLKVSRKLKSCALSLYVGNGQREAVEAIGEVENQLGKTIKSLCSVCGGEYISQEFFYHLNGHGIIAHRTPPYTPQHNDVSERINRTLLDMVRSMMSQTTLPKSFWDYALETAARMVPTKKVEKTPYEHDKLEPMSIKCIFIGYPKETMGYSFYYPPENKFLVARNAEFLENNLITQEASGSLEDLEIIQEDTHPSIDTSLNHEEDDLEIDEPQSDIIHIRRSTRTRRPTDRMCLHIDAEEHELGDLGEPANYKAALFDPESDKWLNAMNVEMQSMKDNEVWDLVNLPPNGKTVGSKWLFKKKTNMDGAVQHLVKLVLFANGWSKTDCLLFNGHLSEEVYMVQPEGFVNPKFPNRVCKMKRSIYGLKQAYRQWNKRFDNEVKKFGFSQNRDEPCVYMKVSESYVTFLILYVDDILIMGNNIPMLQDVKSYLGRCVVPLTEWIFAAYKG